MVAATSVGAAFLVVAGKNAGVSWRSVTIPLVLVAIGILLNVLTASSVRATAGPNGFTVRWGMLGWPSCSYDLAEIATAEVIDLPWRSVSWGFWWTPRRTCATLRSGPAVRLTLRSGRTVTVTVPRPDEAVAAINQARR
jgi:hypothetical protein